MKRFTETLTVVGDYATPITYDNPDVILEEYQKPLRGRHVEFIRIFTERQLRQTSYDYDFRFEANDEEEFFDGLEANAEWFAYDSLRLAAEDLRALIGRGIIVEATASAITDELAQRLAA